MRQKLIAPPRGAREDVILFAVCGFRFAIAACAVSEIRGMDGLQRFLPVPAYEHLEKVEYTLERGGATYFVVNAARHFHLPPSKASRVVILRMTATAVLVDSTDRMAEISVLHALPQAFSGEERKWYRGLAVLDDNVVPVVNHKAFLSSANVFELKALARQLRGAAAV